MARQFQSSHFLPAQLTQPGLGSLPTACSARHAPPDATLNSMCSSSLGPQLLVILIRTATTTSFSKQNISVQNFHSKLFPSLLSLPDAIGQYRALFLFPYFPWAQLHQKLHKPMIYSQYSPCTVWHFFCYHRLSLITTALLAASDWGTPTAHSWISQHGLTAGDSLPAQCWYCCC